MGGAAGAAGASCQEVCAASLLAMAAVFWVLMSTEGRPNSGDLNCALMGLVRSLPWDCAAGGAQGEQGELHSVF